MSLICPEDPNESFAENAAICFEHEVSLVPAEALRPASETRTQLPDPHPDPVADPGGVAADRRRAWSHSVCWYCAKPRAHETNTRCQNQDCRRSLTPPALFIKFPGGEVAVEPGQHAELGRLGTHRKVFQDFVNVSRRHAVVGVTAEGEAWVRPASTINGTFLNDTEIPPDVDRTLDTGDVIRFARNVKGEITCYRR